MMNNKEMDKEWMLRRYVYSLYTNDNLSINTDNIYEPFFFFTMITERFKFFECMGHMFIFDNVIVEEMYVTALFVKKKKFCVGLSFIMQKCWGLFKQ